MMEFQVLARKRLRTPPTPPTPPTTPTPTTTTTTRPTMQHPAHHHHLRVDAVDHHEDADDDDDDDDAYNMDAVGDRLDDDLEHYDDDNDGDNTGEHEEDVMDPSRVNGNATRLKYQKVYTLPHYITQTHALFISPHL